MKIKNFSPNQLAAFTASILSFFIALLILILQKDWEESVIALVAVFVVSYFLIRYIIQEFIYRKIKLIYKFIYQTKASRQQEVYYKYILPRKSIDEVTADVEAWAEQRSREIELLKKNESFRKEFLQNLSHEFKTPVFAIQGFIEILLDGALENKEVNRHFLEKAGRNVERLVHLIQDLDEISKLERGELQLSQGSFVIQDLVAEVFESLSLNAQKQNISFSFKKRMRTATDRVCR